MSVQDHPPVTGMEPPIDARDQAALRAALLKCASALVRDPAEAQALVTQTLANLEQDGGLSSPLSETQMFRLMRQTYHSVERSRRRRPMRDAVVSSMARESSSVPDDQSN